MRALSDFTMTNINGARMMVKLVRTGIVPRFVGEQLLHMKLLLADRYAAFGSKNMSSASTRSNFEIELLFSGWELVSELYRVFFRLYCASRTNAEVADEKVDAAELAS